MSECQRLEAKLADSQKRWDRLREVIVTLQGELDRETRSDEKIRLNSKIEKREAERDEVEQLLEAQEGELRGLRLRQLREDARRMERNRAFDCQAQDMGR